MLCAIIYRRFFYVSYHIMVYSLHRNVLPTLQSTLPINPLVARLIVPDHTGEHLPRAAHSAPSRHKELSPFVVCACMHL